jgi:hypothetical protein
MGSVNTGFTNRRNNVGFGNNLNAPGTYNSATKRCYCSVSRLVTASVKYIKLYGQAPFYSWTLTVIIQERCEPESSPDNTNQRPSFGPGSKAGAVGLGEKKFYKSFKVTNCKNLPECGPCGKNDIGSQNVYDMFISGGEDSGETMPKWAKDLAEGKDPNRVNNGIAEEYPTSNWPACDSDGEPLCPSGDKPCGESDD